MSAEDKTAAATAAEHKHEEHEGEMPDLEHQHDEKKLNRGEKKCRKSLIKLGMKQMTGITRVTLKKRDGLIFVINDPEVLKSGSNENSYAIFGELKLEDPNTRLAQNEAKKFNETETVKAAATETGKKEDEKKEEEEGEPLSEEGLEPEQINMIMQHASCSRNKAIKTLRESNNDMVAAIMKLS